LTLLGFTLRLSFMLGRVYHIDEFISLLAAVMTAQKGLPILPSGLFYDHGLLVSLLSGGLIRLVGFDELVGRWPLLLVGTLSIPAYYAVARRLFSSRLAGLAAAMLAAFDANAILWSGRIRMYALAQLAVLLCLYWLVEAFLRRPRPAARYLFLVFLLMALLSHYVSLLFLPPAAISLWLVGWLWRRGGRGARLRLGLGWGEVAAAGLVLALALAILMLGQIQTTSAIQSPVAQDRAGSPVGFLADFVSFGLDWSRFDDFVYYFLKPPYQLLLPLVALAGLGVAYRGIRRGFDRRDMVWLWLGVSLLLTIFGMGAVLSHTWRKTRYLYILCVPALSLLAAGGVRQLGDGLAAGLSGRLRRGEPAMPQPNAGRYATLGRGAAAVVAGAAIAVFWLPTDWATAHARGTGNYDTAFAYVKQNWQPGDRVMTVHPSASYLYLGRSDYYANQVTARVFQSENDDEDSEWVDRYVGGRLIADEDGLNQVLSAAGRLWFVTDDVRLFSRSRPLFVQQVAAQMDLVHNTGGTLVFLSRPYPRPVPVEPATALSANFGNLLELGGYSFDFKAVRPDGTLQLALYWRPLVDGFPKLYKVFVQLRNGQEQNVAQADHYVLEGLVTNEVLKDLRDQGEWLRDTADLALPGRLPAGSYQLLVGLYDPTTFERLPLAADRSGENALVLQTVSIP
jgi:4-amino-4-deoxy-L-arabinose transferase-like glycosyltransferase